MDNHKLLLAPPELEDAPKHGTVFVLSRTRLLLTFDDSTRDADYELTTNIANSER